MGVVAEGEARPRSKPWGAPALGPVGGLGCPSTKVEERPGNQGTERGCNQRGTVSSGWGLRPGPNLTMGMSPQCHWGSGHEPGGTQLYPTSPGTRCLVVFGLSLEVSEALVSVMRMTWP